MFFGSKTMKTKKSTMKIAFLLGDHDRSFERHDPCLLMQVFRFLKRPFNFYDRLVALYCVLSVKSSVKFRGST